MKKQSFIRRSIGLVLSLALLLAVMPFGVSVEAAAEPIEYFGIVTSTSFLRSSASAASTDNRILNKSGTAITVSRGTVVRLLKEEAPDPADKSHKEVWYKIKYVYMATGEEITGYVYSENMVKRSAVQYAVTDEEFEKVLVNFPESYRPYLRAIHSIYPNWTFTAQEINVDFNTFANIQSEIRQGSSEPTSYSFINKSRTNSKWRSSNTLVDGSSCYLASKSVVEYYLDPRNFLNEVDIMQFEQLGYDSAHQTLDGVNKLLTNTFMEGKTIKTTDGRELTYAQTYMEAAEKSGVSPYSLAISTILENGKSGTKLTDGSQGYYNFYGIGSTPGGSPQGNGLTFAKTGGSWSTELKTKCMIPWNTTYKAIVGGAIFMGTSYISIGQNTPYYKKFDVFSAADGTAIHQYMQAVEYPVDEAKQAYNNYSSLNLLSETRNFIIPVYKNMKENPPALPDTTELVVQIPASDSPILATVFTIRGNTISNIAPGTTVDDFKAKLNINPKATVTISTEGIGTGSVVTLTMDGTTSTYTVVIRGDVNGDGQITTVDLLYMRDSVLDKISLTDVQLKSADIDGDGSVKIPDLLKVRDSILNTYEISQENVN